MKYILQLDGSYFAVSEDSEYYKAVSSLPKDQKSVVFVPETNKKVQAYLAAQKKS